jgi:TolB-like protein/predicted Zn-dependent protease
VSLFTELKRRNVFRVSAAYLALCWVITQVTGAVVPALHLPDSIPSIVVWLAVIGFPFVVLFSWVYELTPEGLKRENEVDRAASITHVTSKRLDYAIIALLALAIGLFALQYFRPPPGVATAQPAAPESGAAASATTQPGAPVADPIIVVNDKSIAVLPFVNMSSDKEQEYFSDGMSEELLNLLSQVPDLKVIARTSSFAFKGKDVPIAEIATTLNVAHVLEGSVRKSGNTVRITAQLVRTADSTHLWSETYDRPLDDIFAVQDEIADAIVQALQIRLAGGELSRPKGGTQNLEAYQLYLRGVSDGNQDSRESLDAAEAYLEQAIKLDPNYGQAWSQLSYVISFKTDSGYLTPKEGYERTRKLAEHALQLSPDLAEAHAQLMYIHLALDGNWSAAKVEGQSALAIDPTDPWALQTAGILSMTLGQWDDAERRLRASLLRDPLNTSTIYSLGQTYYFVGRFEESEIMYREALELAPGDVGNRVWLAKTLLAQGKPEEALAVVQQEVDVARRLLFLPIVLQAVGRKSEADEALKEQIAQWADRGAYWRAQTYAYRGDHDLALEWLERAFQQKNAALVTIASDPLFKNVADDPRFKAFLRKMNLPTE